MRARQETVERWYLRGSAASELFRNDSSVEWAVLAMTRPAPVEADTYLRAFSEDVRATENVWFIPPLCGQTVRRSLLLVRQSETETVDSCGPWGQTRPEEERESERDVHMFTEPTRRQTRTDTVRDTIL